MVSRSAQAWVRLVPAGVEDGANVVGGAGSEAVKRNRAKGPKAPNPLSMKKKKAPVEEKREEKKREVELAAVKRKRRKRTKGIVQQARDEADLEAAKATEGAAQSEGDESD